MGIENVIPLLSSLKNEKRLNTFMISFNTEFEDQ
jgi:hypothetical protein